jgi:hypothetical protein
MGSVSASPITATADCSVFLTSCPISGGNQLLRTTYDSSRIVGTNSRLSHGLQGAAAQKGSIELDAPSSIKRCTTPIDVDAGTVRGNPTIADCTNPTLAAAAQGTSNVWQTSQNATFVHVKDVPVVIDFPSIPTASAANTGYADVIVAAVGVLPYDRVTFLRTSFPLQNVTYSAVCIADQITVRATNNSGVAIDPAAFTAKLIVERRSS